MTCVIGLVDKGSVYIGADSAGVAGLSITIRGDDKVFSDGPFIMGFTSSFRMGQLLRYKFDPPKQTVSQDDMAYMVTDFVDAVRKCFYDNGFGKMPVGDHNDGGNFLVGYKGQLYTIDRDFQVGINAIGYDAVGCGSDIALGAMHATAKGKKPADRIAMALEAASTFSAGVAGPFKILQLTK